MSVSVSASVSDCVTGMLYSDNWVMGKVTNKACFTLCLRRQPGGFRRSVHPHGNDGKALIEVVRKTKVSKGSAGCACKIRVESGAEPFNT